MNRVLDSIASLARTAPERLAIQGTQNSLSYAELHAEILQASQQLQTATVLGIAMDNSPAWAVADLAAMHANIVCVPLPHFFSPLQIAHAIRDASINHIICDQPILLEELLKTQGITVSGKLVYPLAGKLVTQLQLQSTTAQKLPAGTHKVTYTSGTTGNPKGVCLSNEAMLAVASSLLQASAADEHDRHLSILPLSTLLENIAGIYVPLLAGASCNLPGMQDVGLSGASGLDVKKMMQSLHMTLATSTVMTPELLRALVMAIEAGMPRPGNLRFIAVGGAAVSPRLLKRAETLGLPVYEGYGLSECASVVAVNTVKQQRMGSVGKPLPHVTLRFAEDGEILVKGACLLGYTHQDKPADAFYPTGDIGYVDTEGFLFITGRKKNMFITSFGRNVAPEWVERELTMMPSIAQAALFGEARPWNVAVIVPRTDANGNVPQIEDIQQAIDEVNHQLPDYARVQRWVFAQAPFTVQNGQLTANGRLKRETIWQQYATILNAMYEETNDVVL